MEKRTALMPAQYLQTETKLKQGQALKMMTAYCKKDSTQPWSHGRSQNVMECCS